MIRATPVALTLVLAGCALLPGGSSLPPAPAPVEPPEIVDLAPQDPFHPDDIVPFDALEVARFAAEREAAGANRIALPGLPSGADPADFDIPLHYNADVQYWMDYFTGRGRANFELYLTRKGRYEEMILERLRERGMPQDLIYLALIESGFSPRAVSRAQAVGLWQFIAATARRFGLEVSAFTDERRDPSRSTDAALAYLQELYDRFGSWFLVAAAYNSGENRVERVLRERAGGARASDSLYWAIQRYLPAETRSYVPMMIAAAILSKYRDAYGFSIQPEPPERFDIVEVPDATDLDVIAEAAGVSRAEIDALNPQFLRGMTPPGRAVQVRVPEGRGEAFRAAYALIPPEERVRFIEHIVSRGETLSGIAARYGSTVAEIQAANAIRNPNAIQINQRLIIPRAGATRASTVASASTASTSASSASTSARTVSATASTSAASTTVYRVRSGDSLWSIAQRHGVTVADLRAWNGLGNSNTIRPGQELRVAPGGSGAGATVTVYRVRAGDSLWSIAQRHGVTVADLRAWNGLGNSNTIRPGQELRIAAGGSGEAVTRTHEVRRGDTLWAIARLHGVTTAELMEWNGLTPNSVIRPGDVLTLRLAR